MLNVKQSDRDLEAFVVASEKLLILPPLRSLSFLSLFQAQAQRKPLLLFHLNNPIKYPPPLFHTISSYPIYTTLILLYITLV